MNDIVAVVIVDLEILHVRSIGHDLNIDVFSFDRGIRRWPVVSVRRGADFSPLGSSGSVLCSHSSAFSLLADGCSVVICRVRAIAGL